MGQPLMYKLIDQLEKARSMKGITREQLKNIDINIEVCIMQLIIIKREKL
jgi:hypothetical protein